MQQIDLFLVDGGPKLPHLGDGEEIPPGPYKISMLYDLERVRYAPPYSIVAGNGRTIAGHIDNFDAAVWLCRLMNEHPEIAL